MGSDALGMGIPHVTSFLEVQERARRRQDLVTASGRDGLADAVTVVVRASVIPDGAHGKGRRQRRLGASRSGWLCMSGLLGRS